MRKAIPPTCTLAASGSALVWEADHHAGVLDLDDAHGTHAFPGDGIDLTAISPSGSHVALATESTVTVVARADGWAAVVEHELDQPLFRMAIDDDGLVVGVTASEDGDDASVVLLDGERSEIYPVGAVTTFSLVLDSRRRRVLLAGQQGPGSFQGGGEAFVRLLEWTGDGSPWTVLWDGPSPVDAPNGWVMPLTFGDIGVHDLDRFAVLSPDTNPDSVGTVVDELRLGHLESVVSAPDGGFIAWYWNDEVHRGIVRVRTARLADGSVAQHADVDGIDAFPVVAVADDGVVTLVDVVRPSTIRVRRLVEGDVETFTHDLAVPE